MTINLQKTSPFPDPVFHVPCFCAVLRFARHIHSAELVMDRAIADTEVGDGLGLGFGIIISSLTTKYRDLRLLVQVGVQLLMYATPVIYPVSSIPERFQWIILVNPMTPIIEAFRFAFLGAGTVNINSLLYSFGFMLVVVILLAASFLIASSRRLWIRYDNNPNVCVCLTGG
jgi:hypothetical protein